VKKISVMKEKTKEEIKGNLNFIYGTCNEAAGILG
jgi:hypothetical protein